MSLSRTSPRIAIGYGNEIALTTVVSNPNRLRDDQALLPKPPSFLPGTAKLTGPTATSLHFMEKKKHLVVTYAGHGIVCVLLHISRDVLMDDFRIWDLCTMEHVSQIVPRTFPMYVHPMVA